MKPLRRTARKPCKVPRFRTISEYPVQFARAEYASESEPEHFRGTFFPPNAR
jgi:hypothetical protein